MFYKGMNTIISVQNNQYSFKDAFEQFDSHIMYHQQPHAHLPFIKQQMHDMKIDEFFWTDFEAPHKRQSPLAAIGAIVGVIIPTLLFAKKQKPDLKFTELKNLGKNLKEAIDIKYELPQILGVGLGGVWGGLLGGLADRKEQHKIEKLEEASYQTMNVSFPSLLVGGGMKLTEKYKALNKPIFKILVPIVGILTGVNLAVMASNKLDDKLFDKYLPDEERKFKKKDLIVHVDDLFGTLMLAKIPGADKLHVNKILPAIFAWSGYHVGES